MNTHLGCWAVTLMCSLAPVWANEANPINKNQALLEEQVNRAYVEEGLLKKRELAHMGVIAVDGIPRGLLAGEIANIKNVSQVVDPDLSGPEAVPGLKDALRARPAEAKFQEDSSYRRYTGGVFYNSESSTRNIGSAVYVGRGWFASAAHVLIDIKRIGGGFIRPAANNPGSIFSDDLFPINMESMIIDGSRDIAVFQVGASSNRKQAKSVFDVPPTAPLSSLKSLDLVAVAGFPNASGIMAEFSNCRIVRILFPWNNESAQLQADILFLGTCYGGNSGSGIFDQTSGALAGIVRAQGNGRGDFENGVNVRIAPIMENCFRAISIQYAINLIPAY